MALMPRKLLADLRGSNQVEGLVLWQYAGKDKSAPADQWHFGCHDRDELDVCV